MMNSEWHCASDKPPWHCGNDQTRSASACADSAPPGRARCPGESKGVNFKLSLISDSVDIRVRIRQNNDDFDLIIRPLPAPCDYRYLSLSQSRKRWLLYLGYYTYRVYTAPARSNLRYHCYRTRHATRTEQNKHCYILESRFTEWNTAETSVVKS